VKKIWQFITSLKNAIGNLIFLALIAVIIFAIVNRESAAVPESAVMIVNPEGIIVEQERAVDPFEQLLADENAEDPETLGRNIIDAIALASKDDRIKAIALDLSRLRGSSMSLYERIAQELDAFREQGKPVYAFGTGYTQSQYYLASHADHIYIDKDSHAMFSGVFLQGIGMYPLYMKSALDKLSVSINVIKAGLYKDAAEVFIRDDMSEFSRESNQVLVDYLWQEYVDNITEQREVTTENINTYVNSYDKLLKANDSDASKLAIASGLVDALVTRQEWRDEMKNISGESGDTYNHIGYRQYLASVRPPIPVEDPTSDKIAVIIAKGTILDGEQPAGNAGGESVSRLIRQARNNKNVKAIVLRVDSPGGTPSASELIRSELALTQESGKPVVASMGGYAASGGYWIASTSNRIFASETTITGSIGVFSLFPTFENTVEKLGIRSDGVGTNALSGAFNQFAEINPVWEQMLVHSVNHTYDKFLELVAEGRGMTVEEADKVGQGRVWTGAQALEHGLIDAIGGLDEAIESAAMLADVSDFDVIYMEKQLSPREQFIRQILDTSVSLLPRFNTSLFSLVPAELRTLSKMIEQPAVYLQCVTCRVSF
jgi:protease-4